MYLGGSGGGIVMFVLALLSALASITECYSYYELIPKVQFLIDRQVFVAVQGDYVSYGPNTDFSKILYVIDDPFFGCVGANDTAIPSFPSQSAFLLPESSHCSNTEKSSFLSRTYEARGVVLYRLSDSSDEEDRERRQTAQRPNSSRGPTVVKVSVLTEQIAQLVSKQSAGSRIQVIVEAQLIQRGFRTTQTFYFVVFAFCILMLLSCSWLLLSYFKRCHYRWRLRRNQARSANETRQMVNRLPTKSYKSSKEKGEVPTCVVCLEVFKNHESIRILPCKHEFHKKCIDPWLKMKRTCPMCKQDIFPSKRRQRSRSTSDSANERNATRASSQDPTAVLVTAAAPPHAHQRSLSWSSNDSGSSQNLAGDNNSVASSIASSSLTQEMDTSETPLLGSASVGSMVQVIMVNPSAADSSVQGMEAGVGERSESTAVEVEVSESTGSFGQEQQQQGQREQRRGNESEHIRVDIEGLGLVRPAPVVNA